MLLATFCVPTRTQAATIVWGNTGTAFSTGTNWVGGNAPADSITTDIGSFTNATVVANPQLTANRSIAGLIFAAGTGTWTFTGTATDRLTIGASGIVNNSSSTQTFTGANLNLRLGANSTFSGDSGALVFAASLGGIALNGFNLTLAGGSASNSIADVIGGSGNLVKTGSGTWTLSGANTYTGTTSIGTAGGASGGTLLLGANNALPGTAVNVYAGTLDVNTRTDTIGALSLGGGAGGTTAQVLLGTGGVLTLGGTVTYDAANNPNGATISGTGNLALGGNRTFTVGDSSVAADDLTISATITGANNITKNGAGVLVLSGSNSYTGTTAVSVGALNVRNNNALGTTANGTTVSSGAALELQNNITVTGETLSLAGTGVGTNGALRNISGTNIWTGATTLTAASEIQSDAGLLSISGNVTAANFGLTVDGGGNTAISGVVGLGTGGVNKIGVGTLTLSGNNTYSGTTTISNGVINIQNNNALGNTTGGTTVASGAALELQNNITVTGETLSLAGTGISNNGALRNISGTNTWTGAVTLSTNAEIQTDSGRLIVSGPISSTNQNLTVDGAGNTTLAGTIGLGAGALTKTGAGTLTISGSNSSSGIMAVNGGKLEVATNTSLGTGAISLDGGTLRTTATMAITPSTRTMNIGTNGGTVETVAGTTLTYEGIMLGAGKLTKTGTGIFQTGQLANYNVAAAVGGVANAGLGIASYFNFDQLTVGTTNTSVTVTNSFGPSNSMTVIFTGDTGVRQGNSTGQWAAPFLSGGNGSGFGTNGTQQTNGVDSTPYLATGGSTNSTITFVLNPHVEYLGILWGSVDAGLNNTLTFRDETNGILFTITGQDVLNSPNGNQGTNGTVYANINSDRPIYSIVATSPQPAFEFDNIALAPQVLRTGPVDILEGTFQIINAGFFSGIGTNDPVFVASGATLSLKGNTNLTQQTIGNLSGAGTVINVGAAAVNFRINASSNSTFSGTITDTTNNLNLVKLGSGTLTLTGNSSYKGTTVISNGVINIQNNTALGTAAGGTTVASGAALELQNNIIVAGETLSLAGTGVGTNGAMRNISGTNAWTGAITLTAASEIQNDAGLLNISGNVSSTNAGLTVDTTGNTILSGVIGLGTGSLTKNGEGTLTLGGANTYTGVTTVNGGTLAVSTNAAVATTSGINMSNATFLYTPNASATIDRNFTVTGGTATMRNSGSGTLTLSGDLTNNGTTLKFAEGSFSMTGSIIGTNANSDLVVDSARVTLNDSNSYNGTTYLRNAGVLTANVAGALPTNIRTAVIMDDTGAGGSTLALGTNQQIASLTGADSSMVTLGANTLTIGTTSGSTTFAGMISGTGGVVKDGNSTQILTGSNSFTGPLTISAGTVQIGDGTDSGSIGSTMAITNNGSLVYKVADGNRTLAATISGTGSLTQDSPGGILTVTGSNSYTGGTTVTAGQIHVTQTNGLGTGAVTVDGSPGSPAALRIVPTDSILHTGPLTLNGYATLDVPSLSTFESSGAISINGPENFVNVVGNVWLEGTNTLVTGSSLTLGDGASIRLTGSAVNEASLALGESATVGRTTYTFGSNATSLYMLSVGGGHLDLVWTGTENNIWNTNATNWQNSTNGLNPSGPDIPFVAMDDVYFGNAATNGPISVATNGVQAGHIYVTNTAGTVVLQDGTIKTDDFTKSGAGDLVIKSDLSMLDSDFDFNEFFVNSGTGSLLVEGSISGQANILQSGTGTLTLAASNSLLGTTTISAGAIVLGTNNALGAGPINVSGGTLATGTYTQSVGAVTLNSGAITGSGTITATSYTVKDGSISANLAGTNGLDKTTAGTVTLSGTNTYTGLTHITGGTLQIGADANLGNATNGLHLEGGTLKITASITNTREITLTGNGTFDTGANTLALDGTVIGGGTLVKTGTGTIVLSGSNTYSGGTTLSTGELQLKSASAAGTGAIVQSNGATLVIDTTGGIVNNMSVYDITFLQGADLTGTITLNETEFYVTNNVTATSAGLLEGTGGVNKTGAGTLILEGAVANTFTGASTVTGGTLVLSNSVGSSITGTSIQVDAGATLVLGTDNQIGDGTGLILNGGTFIAGTSTAGYSDTLGTLTLSASSTIDLGSFTGLHSITFADSSAITWAPNAILTISNWQGLTRSPGEAAQILFGGTAGLTSTQLAQIRFAPIDGRPLVDGGVLLGSSPGELVPIPEAKIAWGAAALLGAVLWRERKRLCALLRRHQ